MFKYRNHKNMVITIFLSSLWCYSLASGVFGATKGQTETETKFDIEGFKKPVLEYKSQNLRNPFRDFLPRREEVKWEPDDTEKDTYAEEKPPSLTVQGVIWGGPIPQAIINNKVVKIGDTIEEAKITDIGKEGVTVLYKKDIYKLSSPASSYMTQGEEEVTK